MAYFIQFLKKLDLSISTTTLFWFTEAYRHDLPQESGHRTLPTMDE